MNMPDTPRDQAFLDFRAGPSRATLTRLLEIEQHHVFNVCFHVLGHRADAEDAAQEVLLRAVEAASTVADAQHWRRWLTRASVNAALDAARAKNRRSGLAERRAAMETARDPAAGEGEALGEALAGLEDDDRALVVGHFLEKISLENLGRERGVSGQAIWKRLERAKERMREVLTAAGCAAVVPGLEGAVPAQATRNLVSGPVAAKISAAFGVAAATAAGGVIVASKAWTVAVIMAVLLAGVLGVGIPRYREESGRARQAALLEHQLAQEHRGRVAAEAELARVRDASVSLTPPVAHVESPPTGPAPAPALASIPDRLDALLKWMRDLREEIGKLEKTTTGQQIQDHLHASLEARIADCRALREAVFADPATILERLAGPESEGDRTLLYMLLGGDLERKAADPDAPFLELTDLPPAIVDGLFDIIRRGAPDARLGALQFLGRGMKHPPEWDERFFALLDDPDPAIRHGALGPLMYGRKEIPAQHLASLEKIAESTDEESRNDGIYAISRVKTKEAHDYLMERLASEKDAVAIEKLAQGLTDVARKGDDADRARLVESLRAALPHATTAEACRALAFTSLELPLGEGRGLLVALDRACTDQDLRLKLDRILAAIEGGETCSSTLCDMLLDGK